MNKLRSQYLYKFLGSIRKKNKRQSPKHTQYFYQLKVKLAGQSHYQKIFGFQQKTKSSVWNSLEDDSYVGKNYLLHCRNYQGSYYLVDWEEVNE